MRDPRTGQEVERPYHEGMEQQLPERFKVKFVAFMPWSQDPVATVPPGRSFLFLYRFKARGVMPLLGVVEVAQLVHRSADPWTKPHVYHLHVRRLQGQVDCDITYQGVESDAGAALRNTLVHHFGVSAARANAVPVARHPGHPMFLLHLPGGTPSVPSG